MRRSSVACVVVSDSAGNRVRGCGAGWMDEDVRLASGRDEADRCPNCQGPLTVTGTFVELALR